MNVYKTRGFILSLLLLLLILVPIKVEAASSNVYIGDYANLLSDEDEQKLESYLSTLKADYKYVVITNETDENGIDADSRLAYYYDNTFSRYDDGIAFIIDMYSREIYIEAFGDIQGRIGDGDSTDITDNVYRYASNGDYLSCITNAFKQADTLVNKGFILRPMRYLVSLLIAVVIGFLIAFYMAVFERSKSVKHNPNAQILMTGAAIAATSSIYDTRRIRKNRTDGHHGGFSSGGYSGGSFSGGGFSGGGSSGGFSGGGGGGFSGGGHSGGGHSF